MPNSDLFESTRQFFDPEFIHVVSAEFHEPEMKIEESLRVVIPTVLTEVIARGATDEGATALTQSSQAKTIFGEHYAEVRKELTVRTGMPSSNIERLIDLITPAVFEVIDSKVRSEGMSAHELSGYLQAQKKVLKGFHSTHRSEAGPEGEGKKFFWIFVGLVLIGVLGSFWLLVKITRPVSSLRRSLATVYPPSQVVTEGPRLKDIPAFLRVARSTDFPLVFSAATAIFQPGTTNMLVSADTEIDVISRALKAHPRLFAVIQGFIEESGGSEENQVLSENRAMLVRQELIGHGVKPSRLRAVGAGLTRGGVQIKLTLDLIK